VDDLGVEPTTILLHNPEVSLMGLDPVEAFERLQAACALLEEMPAAGLCGQWGWSTWNSGPILAALGAAHGPFPAPAVVMVRAGLLVDPDGLDDAERLFTLLGVPAEGRWGMSPFGAMRASRCGKRSTPGCTSPVGRSARRLRRRSGLRSHCPPSTESRLAPRT
jgi:pyridoxine 4-dehydrogenase